MYYFLTAFHAMQFTSLWVSLGALFLWVLHFFLEMVDLPTSCTSLPSSSESSWMVCHAAVLISSSAQSLELLMFSLFCLILFFILLNTCQHRLLGSLCFNTFCSPKQLFTLYLTVFFLWLLTLLLSQLSPFHHLFHL